jgi:hypothetical protein
MPIGSGKIWFAFSLVAFLASYGIATALGFLKPYRNWDMVAYTGAAISWHESDPEVVYQKTLQDVGCVVSTQQYKEITENLLSINAENFRQNLPFYTSKPVYVAGVRLIRWAGLSRTYSAATWILAALSFGGFAVLLLWWRSEYIHRSIWLLVLAAFCWFGNHPLSILARYSTPDSMALITVFGSFLSLFKLKRPFLGIILMLLAILIRPEMAVLAVMLAAVCFVMEKSVTPVARAQSVVLGISAIVLFFSIQAIFGGYGYQKFFYYTYVHIIPNPADVEVHLKLTDYWLGLMTGLRNIFTDSRLLPFFFLSLVAVFLHFQRRPGRSVYPWLLLLGWGNYAVRFLLLPAWRDYRFYSINYLLILIACCEMIAAYIKHNPGNSGASPAHNRE